MKVAVNTLFLIPGEVGGSETYLRETLLAVVRGYPDISLLLITNRENDAALRKPFGSFPQCSFHPLPVRATNRYARIIAEQTRLPWMLRQIKPDVLWSPGYTMPFWAPCRQVVSILDMQYRSHPDDLTRLARWTTHALVMMAARRADRIIAISEFSKHEIIRHTGCPAERIAVTHLGVDAGFAEGVQVSGFGVREEERRTKNQEPHNDKHRPYESPNTEHRTPNTHTLQPITFNLSAEGGSAYGGQPSTLNLEPPFILSVANSYPHKNLHRLVEAFALIKNQIPHQLVLVGRPRLGEPDLVRALEKIPPERVRRISGLSREELIDLYQSADLFVFPSLYEGFGLPVLEAMMAGVPVITTREGAIPEIGGDAVIYANSRDPVSLAAAIQSAICMTPECRTSWVESARLNAQRFTWSVAANLTIKACENICNGVIE